MWSKLQELTNKWPPTASWTVGHVGHSSAVNEGFNETNWNKYTSYLDWRISPHADRRHQTVCHTWLYKTCITKIVHILTLGANPWAKVHQKGRWTATYPGLPSCQISSRCINPLLRYPLQKNLQTNKQSYKQTNKYPPYTSYPDWHISPHADLRHQSCKKIFFGSVSNTKYFRKLYLKCRYFCQNTFDLTQKIQHTFVIYLKYKMQHILYVFQIHIWPVFHTTHGSWLSSQFVAPG